mmetsp:Transcript_41807/g.61194  ORF Transcript_41807/g.61194 Transcript_41807/m.61194 type:complete len:281 (+) Transcript_41807:74-916(+)
MLARQSQLHCHRLIIRHNNQFSIVYNKLFATTTKKLNFKMAEAEDTTTMPTDKGMTLYLKSGQNPSAIGDCPFAHYVRIVLHETHTTHTVQPCNKETKPKWLIENYNGSMPALRHDDRCIVESVVIVSYVNSLEEDKSVKDGGNNEKETREAKEVLNGFFPALAKYLKHTPDGADTDEELKQNLGHVLTKFESYLTNDGTKKGSYWVGDGTTWTLVDCSLIPKLYHMKVGLQHFKKNAIDLEKDYPALWKYMCAAFDRESVKETLYPEDLVVWGWSNARL